MFWWNRIIDHHYGWPNIRIVTRKREPANCREIIKLHYLICARSRMIKLQNCSQKSIHFVLWSSGYFPIYSVHDMVLCDILMCCRLWRVAHVNFEYWTMWTNNLNNLVACASYHILRCFVSTVHVNLSWAAQIFAHTSTKKQSDWIMIIRQVYAGMSASSCVLTLCYLIIILWVKAICVISHQRYNMCKGIGYTIVNIFA